MEEPVVIPKTLEETALALDRMLDEENRRMIREAKNAEEVQDIIIWAHHGLGRYLRNTWGLWTGSELATHMRDVHGIEHPDDMSHAIMEHYARWCIKSRYERIRESKGEV